MPYKDDEVRKEYERNRQKRVRDSKRAAGICARCTEKSIEGEILCATHKTYSLEQCKKSVAKDLKRAVRWGQHTRKNLRNEVLSHYGTSCACCGESEDAFLTVDHIDGSGAEHRKIIGAGNNLYRWLRKNRFPGGFRTLCANCNLAMGIHGQCPHGNLAFQITNHPANIVAQRGRVKECTPPNT